jgi:hypothetical protein
LPPKFNKVRLLNLLKSGKEYLSNPISLVLNNNNIEPLYLSRMAIQPRPPLAPEIIELPNDSAVSSATTFSHPSHVKILQALVISGLEDVPNKPCFAVVPDREISPV